jgi:hypothetical protein
MQFSNRKVYSTTGQAGARLCDPRAPAWPSNALRAFFLHARVRAEILSQSRSQRGRVRGARAMMVAEPGVMRPV